MKLYVCKLNLNCTHNHDIFRQVKYILISLLFLCHNSLQNIKNGKDDICLKHSKRKGVLLPPNLINRGLATHIFVIELGHHWLM